MKNITEVARSEKKNRVKWGFIWALLCALFWGLGYVPLTMFWYTDPIGSQFGIADPVGGYMITSLILAAFQAIFFALVLTLVWTVCTGKLREYKKVITNKKSVKYLLIGCLFGGPLAIFGSALTIGYIGGDFAAGIALLCSVTAVLFGRIMNHEKLSKKTIIGLIILIIGGIVIVEPSKMIDNILNSGDGAVWGYIGALMSIIGWGIEGNIAVKALDVNDADACNPVRFAIEAIVWLICLLPIIGVFVGFNEFYGYLFEAISCVPLVYWMVLAGLSLGFCYVAEYKAFPLIGVGRTLSMATLYVPVSFIGLACILGYSLNFWVVIGALIAIGGTFVMYWESDSLLDSSRDVGGE